MEIIVPSATGVAGLIIGMIVGYYKSRAEFLEKMNKKVSKADCMDCDLRRVVGNITGELKEGSNAFKAIQEDIGAIRTSIAVLEYQSGGKVTP